MISPITTTMPSSARCIAGPGWAARSMVEVTRAPFASLDSRDVSAEGCEPAGGGGGGGVGDEQGGGEADRQFVFVAGEREAGAAGQELGGAWDEAFGDAFDQEHPGAEADERADLVADERADADAEDRPERGGRGAAHENARVVAAGELVGDAAQREGDRGGRRHQPLGEQPE